MQSTVYKYIPKRSRYYQDMIDLNILEKGTADDVSEDMKALLNYIDGQLPSNDYTNELEAVGYKRGIEKGALQNAEQTAIAMLLEGELSLDKISKYTKLSIEKLNELQTELVETNSK